MAGSPLTCLLVACHAILSFHGVLYYFYQNTILHIYHCIHIIPGLLWICILLSDILLHLFRCDPRGETAGRVREVGGTASRHRGALRTTCRGNAWDGGYSGRSECRRGSVGAALWRHPQQRLHALQAAQRLSHFLSSRGRTSCQTLWIAPAGQQ